MKKKVIAIILLGLLFVLYILWVLAMVNSYSNNVQWYGFVGSAITLIGSAFILVFIGYKLIKRFWKHA
jgi:hypothetical protein